jgi:hypothetical protein
VEEIPRHVSSNLETYEQGERPKISAAQQRPNRSKIVPPQPSQITLTANPAAESPTPKAAMNPTSRPETSVLHQPLINRGSDSTMQRRNTPWIVGAHSLVALAIALVVLILLSYGSLSNAVAAMVVQIGVVLELMVGFSFTKYGTFPNLPKKWQIAWFPVTAAASLGSLIYFSVRLADEQKRSDARETELKWDSSYFLLSMNASLASLGYALWETYQVILKIRAEEEAEERQDEFSDSEEGDVGETASSSNNSNSTSTGFATAARKEQQRQSAMGRFLYDWYKRTHAKEPG